MYQRLIDMHVHSDNSPDGNHTAMYVCEKAELMGVRALAFTDHCEVDSYYDESYDNFVCAGAQYNDDAVYINEVVEKFHQMAADLKQRTESVMEYISQIQRAVEEGSEGINLAAKNTATLSEEISHISSQIMYNKKIADVLSEEAEHFI